MTAPERGTEAGFFSGVLIGTIIGTVVMGLAVIGPSVWATAEYCGYAQCKMEAAK